MADERDPLEQLLDAALFGPVGLFLELRDRFPDLAEKGRQHLQTQVTVARMVGKFAVQMGTKKVADYVQQQRQPAPAPAAGAPASPAGPVGDAAATTAPAAADVTEVAPGWVAADLPHAPDPDALPIPGYDTLAASQVVARLDGLDADALEAVRRYEASHRNRKTILGKVAQLQRAA